MTKKTSNARGEGLMRIQQDIFMEAGIIHAKTGLMPKDILRQRAELLEALQEMVMHMEDMCRSDGLDKARAAISRALGENKE